jgi:predicted transcriptional regulator YdeE
MEAPICLYSFFTSKKEINNIKQFWFVTINKLLISTVYNFVHQLIIYNSNVVLDSSDLYLSAINKHVCIYWFQMRDLKIAVMEAPICLYSFFTSKKEINNIKQFWFVTINKLFISTKQGFFCQLIHVWWGKSIRVDHMYSNF